MNESSSNLDFINSKKHAVIALALGLTRGILYDVAYGKVDKVDSEEIKRILEITSLKSLAERIGCSEDELAIDWNEYLSPSELDISSETDQNFSFREQQPAN